jgi:hypothetical protein
MFLCSSHLQPALFIDPSLSIGIRASVDRRSKEH